MPVLRVLAFLGGALVVVAVLSSAVRTVVVPRNERVFLTRAVLLVVRDFFHWLAGRNRTLEAKENTLARFAPVALMLLPLVWASGVVLGFMPIYWALGVDSWRDAFELSGSSLTTLGFARPEELPAVAVVYVEALIGFAIVALLISFLPTIYGHFHTREVAVSRLEVRAGIPPSPVEMLSRAHRIGILESLTDVWEEWAIWFLDIEESHTSFPPLVWFRSPEPGRNWVTAAGASLDAAAISISTLELQNQWEASLFIRSGYLSLRRIAQYFDLPFDNDPRPTDAISVTQEEFYDVYERLAAEQLPMKPDREQAWRDFAGWRVNYDKVLLQLCALVEAPPAHWSSDRAPDYVRPRLFGTKAPRGSESI